MTIAFPMRIIQQALPARGIVLQGASLPTKGSFSMPGEQRTNIDWMPGSPVAVTQVMGATEEPITMAGIFRDTKVAYDHSCATLINFPFLSASAQPQTGALGSVIGGPVFLGTTPQPEQKARTAIAISEALDRLRLEGAICKLEWGPYVRFGLVGFYQHNDEMASDIPWELEFRVTGRSLSQPKPSVKSVSLPGLLKALLAAIQKILDKIFSVLGTAGAWLGKIAAGIDRVVALLLELADMLKQSIDLATAPFDLLQRIRSSLQSIVAAAKDVAFSAKHSVPSVQVTVSASGDPVDIADATIDGAELLDLIVDAGVEAATRSAEIEQLATSQLLGVIVAPSAMSLQTIAARFYGSPAAWTAIRDFNDLTSPLVQRGTVVSVPRLS